MLTGKKSDKVTGWVRSRGLLVEKKVYLGPQILWLKAGSLPVVGNRIMVLIVVPRPEEPEPGTASGAWEPQGPEEGKAEPDTTLLGRRPTVKIKSPYGGPLFAEPSIEWEVGDIIVLEGGEDLYPTTGDICMLSIVHLTNPEGGIASGEDEGQQVP